MKIKSSQGHEISVPRHLQKKVRKHLKDGNHDAVSKLMQASHPQPEGMQSGPFETGMPGAQGPVTFGNGGYIYGYPKYSSGGTVNLTTPDGEKHRVYIKESPTGVGKGVEGHVMVNHPTTDKGKWDTIDLTEKSGAKTVEEGKKSVLNWHNEHPQDEYGKGGYIVKRSSARKGKTHVVIGPDGTKKYFGDSKLGQHPNDPGRKKAFYARHKHNLAKNPYFRAFARKTWGDGGYIYGYPQYDLGGDIGAGLTGFVGGVAGSIPLVGGTLKKGVYGLDEAIQGPLNEEEKSVRGYSGAAGSAAAAIASGGATLPQSISSGAQDLGQGIAHGSPTSKSAQAIGQGLGVAGQIGSMAVGTPDAGTMSQFGQTGFGQLSTSLGKSAGYLNPMASMMGNMGSYRDGGYIYGYPMYADGGVTPEEQMQQAPQGAQGMQGMPSNQNPDGTVGINVEGIGRSQGPAYAMKKGELLVKDGKVYKNYVSRPPHPKEGTNPEGDTDEKPGMVIIPLNRTQEYLNSDIRGRKMIEKSLKSQQEARANKALQTLKQGGYIYGAPYAKGGKIVPCDACEEAGETHSDDEEAEMMKKGGWIQKATRSIKRRGTEGVCTGSKFGGPGCPPGSRRYNLAKTFRAMAKKREDGGSTEDYIYGYPEYAMGGSVTEVAEKMPDMDIKYGKGGGIYIKPANRGKFTSWAKSHGMGVQEAAKHVMANKDKYSSTIVKRANFAKNAAKWKHEYGGSIMEHGGYVPGYPQYQDGGDLYAGGGNIYGNLGGQFSGHPESFSPNYLESKYNSLPLPRFNYPVMGNSYSGNTTGPTIGSISSQETNPQFSNGGITGSFINGKQYSDTKFIPGMSATPERRFEQYTALNRKYPQGSFYPNRSTIDQSQTIPTSMGWREGGYIPYPKYKYKDGGYVWEDAIGDKPYYQAFGWQERYPERAKMKFQAGGLVGNEYGEPHGPVREPMTYKMARGGSNMFGTPLFGKAPLSRNLTGTSSGTTAPLSRMRFNYNMPNHGWKMKPRFEHGGTYTPGYPRYEGPDDTDATASGTSVTGSNIVDDMWMNSVGKYLQYDSNDPRVNYTYNNPNYNYVYNPYTIKQSETTPSVNTPSTFGLGKSSGMFGMQSGTTPFGMPKDNTTFTGYGLTPAQRANVPYSGQYAGVTPSTTGTTPGTTPTKKQPVDWNTYNKYSMLSRIPLLGAHLAEAASRLKTLSPASVTAMAPRYYDPELGQKQIQQAYAANRYAMGQRYAGTPQRLGVISLADAQANAAAEQRAKMEAQNIGVYQDYAGRKYQADVTNAELQRQLEDNRLRAIAAKNLGFQYAGEDVAQGVDAALKNRMYQEWLMRQFPNA